MGVLYYLLPLLGLMLVGITNGATACNTTYMMAEARSCEMNFFKAMVNDTNANCSTEYNKINICVGDLAKKCYPQLPAAVIENLVMTSMGQVKGFSFYCARTEMTLHWPNVPQALQSKLPCQIEYYNESAGCATEFREKFAENPKGAHVCRAFDEAETCINGLANTYCPRNPPSPAGPRHKYPYKLCPAGSSAALTRLGSHALMVTQAVAMVASQIVLW